MLLQVSLHLFELLFRDFPTGVPLAQDFASVPVAVAVPVPPSPPPSHWPEDKSADEEKDDEKEEYSEGEEEPPSDERIPVIRTCWHAGIAMDCKYCEESDDRHQDYREEGPGECVAPVRMLLAISRLRCFRLQEGPCLMLI